jgi:outer membrane scaffolding protein for murein synthesis (MipA/OmpV family)
MTAATACRGFMHKKQFTVATLFLASAGAWAAPPAETKLPLWEAGVGVGGVTTPAYPGAETHSSRGLLLPFLIYRGEVLRSDQGGIGARLVNTDALEFDIGFAASLPAHSKDVAARDGMPDLGTLVEFGPRVKLRIADIDANSRLRFDLPLRAVIEAKGGLRRQGWTLEPRLVYETHGEDKLWTAEAHVGMVFGDARINRYFYEVRPEFARGDRPAYHADGGLMLWRTGVFATRRVHPDVRLFGFLRYESYAGAANHDSPLMKRAVGTSAGFGLAWTLGRSTARAHD